MARPSYCPSVYQRRVGSFGKDPNQFQRSQNPIFSPGLPTNYHTSTLHYTWASSKCWKGRGTWKEQTRQRAKACQNAFLSVSQGWLLISLWQEARRCGSVILVSEMDWSLALWVWPSVWRNSCRGAGSSQPLFFRLECIFIYCDKFAAKWVKNASSSSLYIYMYDGMGRPWCSFILESASDSFLKLEPYSLGLVNMMIAVTKAGIKREMGAERIKQRAGMFEFANDS